MKSRRFVCFVALAGACLLLSSCGGSKNPLSDPAKAKADAQLMGVWRMTDSSGVSYVHVGCAGGKLPPGIMEAIIIGHNVDGTLNEPEQMLMFSTIIGGNHYLNLVNSTKAEDSNKNVAKFIEEGWKPDLIKAFCLVKYEVKGDALVFGSWMATCNASSSRRERFKGWPARTRTPQCSPTRRRNWPPCWPRRERQSFQERTDASLPTGEIGGDFWRCETASGIQHFASNTTQVDCFSLIPSP